MLYLRDLDTLRVGSLDHCIAFQSLDDKLRSVVFGTVLHLHLNCVGNFLVIAYGQSPETSS